MVFVLLLTAGAAGAPSLADMRRARTAKPSADYLAPTVHDMGHVLNRHLRRLSSTALAPCDDFDLPTLRTRRLRLSALTDPELVAIYPFHDGRRPRDAPAATTDVPSDSALATVQRDGLCHEVVLMLVHHLTASARELVLGEGEAYPLLPTRLHARSDHSPGEQAGGVFDAYESQVSCQQCHTGRIASSEWRDATLPPPLPVDKEKPGRERQRSCDYQNQPPCRPCEGLGGPRTGDTSETFMPVPCEVLATPEEVAPSQRVAGKYPPMGSARILGGVRSPVAVRPEPGHPGKYSAMNATIYLGWDANGTARQRYDFSFGSQIYLQTAEMRARNETGAMITLLPPKPSRTAIHEAISLLPQLEVASMLTGPSMPVSMRSAPGTRAQLEQTGTPPAAAQSHAPADAALGKCSCQRGLHPIPHPNPRRPEPCLRQVLLPAGRRWQHAHRRVRAT